MNDVTTTEAPRNDAGQFESTEPAFGREGLNRAAGYVPVKAEAEEPPEELTVKEAAEKRLYELSGSESKIITHTAGLADNEYFEKFDDAVNALGDARDADAAQAEIDGKKAAQKEIDKLRGEKPEAKQEVEPEPDLDKVLSHPKVRDAITERVTAADAQRAQYETGVAEAGKVAIATLASDFPELGNLPLDQWQSALQQMHAHEPARFQQAIGRIQAVAHIEQAHTQIQADKASREAAEFQTYAKAEDARFADMVKGERNMPAIEAEIVAMVKEHGVDPREFFKAGNESKFLRSAAAQKILVDAAKYRMIVNAPKAIAKHDVPPVQRPGIAAARADRGHSNLASLNEKLSKSGSLKDAQALLAARRSKGR